MTIEQDQQPGRQWFGSFSQSEKSDELPGGCGRLAAASDSRLCAYTAERPSGQAGLADPFGVPSGSPDGAC